MFGRGRERGQATVVARVQDDDLHRYGAGFGPASDRWHNGWKYVVDVQPDSGADRFRATFLERFAQTGEFHEPFEGERVPVTFDKDRQVEFDRDFLRDLAKQNKAAVKGRFDAIANAAPGSGADPASADAQAAEFRAMRIRAAITRAREAGNDAEIDRLQGMLERVEAGDLSLPTDGPASAS